ncbi:tRNA uridine 5-carboxymethylaminomethyl modification protein, partial [Clostridium botulinum D/C]|nr:tRNA uridine 5-carboxymethylaminomethyl modification protein [Clostridium botulinum D/C]MCD3301264.1 tRNA uridine 5-carboxymethylaminomethyl modification protein [Clostridium botulinum D/C]MCD3328397.1 tRNA uridine 5-carboxymethylaminomethyl modification protein [Clostridium botulinum D/C]MCD3331569.1 tRNA uridine 5-carboxymethylaminomethyl modification protein [Clostridium botulinum D/C]MCD3334523.1 tRNA uridine 5-carboxymethylaminomethyl modification protein [Clostridium botulinum D/C]
NAMKVIGIDNLFCGGEKSGLFVGHTDTRQNIKHIFLYIF